jgi:hypothetical protein
MSNEIKNEDGELLPDVENQRSNQAMATETARQALLKSDLDMVRVVEDLIDLLIEHQVFIFTDLPEPVQRKLNSRKKLRHQMNSLQNLVDENEDKIF